MESQQAEITETTTQIIANDSFSYNATRELKRWDSWDVASVGTTAVCVAIILFQNAC